MYIPHQFKNEDISEVKEFLRENSFGILVNQVDGKPWASHIPIELEEDEHGETVLFGHVSKLNDQWKSFESNQEVLAIFNGPHAYVSSSWYNHENVPTWNYIAVHVYGMIKILDKEELFYSLKKLVDKYESDMERPVSMETFSEKTLRQMKGIVGFKIQIKNIQAAYKLSQNRNQEDYHQVIGELEKGNDHSKATAKAMKNSNKL